MKITIQFNKYVNALIKEFSTSNIEMYVSVDKKVLRFTPNQYDFKTIRELFKEISLFPLHEGKRISFALIEANQLLECINRFKKWASLNGYVFQDDEAEWNRLYELYK